MSELSEEIRNILTTLWQAEGKPGVRAWAIYVALTFAINKDPNINKREAWSLIKKEFVNNLGDAFPEQEEPGQSYRRASGDAWEMFVEEYLNSNKLLRDKGLRAVRLSGDDFNHLAKALDVNVRPKDVDLFLQGVDETGTVRVFGALFPKASYAERIRADEGASRILMKKGLWCATVTLDAREELGTEENPSVKRKTINSGAFDGCYSFNENTVSGPNIHIVRCTERGMRNPFIKAIIGAWKENLNGQRLV